MAPSAARWIGSLLLGLFAAPADAQQLFTDRASFEAALSQPSPPFAPEPAGDGFEAEPAAGLNSITRLDTGSGAVYRVVDGQQLLGVLDQPSSGIEASQGLAALVTDIGGELLIDFKFPVEAFAFDIIDFGDGNRDETPLVYRTTPLRPGEELTGVAATTPADDGNVQFFGLISLV